MEQDLSLREALAEDRLDDFVRQEEDRGAELANGSEFERALVPLVAQRMAGTRWMSDVRSARSTRVVERCLAWIGSPSCVRRFQLPSGQTQGSRHSRELTASCPKEPGQRVTGCWPVVDHPKEKLQ